jgi:ABC-type spermidine/putrescine transport system permease subunit II
MKFCPSPGVNLSRFDKPTDELDVLYGLPRKVMFCTNCNMSNQQPMSSNEYSHNKDSTKTTLSFDADGLCHACRFNRLKETGEIDWDERERELLDLCNQYRSKDGSYDCIVGGSGGKDSAMQSHLLKYKYGMHPLTVTWSPHLYTDIGWKNFQNWVHVGGFDNFLYTPNGKIHRLLTRNATINTFLYAGAASAIAIVLALCVAYAVNRELVGKRLGGVLSFLTMAPFVIPGIVLAIGFYAAYSNPPFLLYGTPWILILAFATRFLPIAYSNSTAAIRSINPELEDAVRILGGSRFTAISRVVMPLLKRSLAGAFILVFIPATRELSTAIFLYSINTQVLSVLLFDKSDEGNFEMLAAIGLILVFITVAMILIGFRLMGRDFMLRRTAA